MCTYGYFLLKYGRNPSQYCKVSILQLKIKFKKKQMGQEYTEELYKDGLNDPDNHNGVVTHLKPDILECEVKWSLGSISTNKASGGNGIPAEVLKNPKK